MAKETVDGIEPSGAPVVKERISFLPPSFAVSHARSREQRPRPAIFSLILAPIPGKRELPDNHIGPEQAFRSAAMLNLPSG